MRPKPLLARCALLLPLAAASAFGQTNIRAIADGDWSDPLTWTAGIIPTDTNNATGDDAIVVAGFTVGVTAAQTARRLLVGEDGVPGSTVGTVTMNGGSLTLDGIYIGTDVDNSGLGSTPGNGVFNFIDGTITLNENINAADPFSQAVEIGTQSSSEGLMIMGDGTTNPALSHTNGRFEVGGEGDNGAGNTTGTFTFNSGAINGTNQNLIIGQSNTGGVAIMTVGDTTGAGFVTPATYTTTADLNLNAGSVTLTIGNLGSVTGRDLQYDAQNNQTSTVTIQSGGTLTVNDDMNDRGGNSVLNIEGGTLVLNDLDDAGTGTREVENLTIGDGSTLTFAIDNNTTNGIKALDVTGDDARSAVLSGTITIDPQIATEANNSALLDTWVGGGGAVTWNPDTPNGADWDQGTAPDQFGAIQPGTTWDVLVYESLLGGFDNLLQGNADGEFDTTALIAVLPSDPLAWSVSPIDADVDLAPEGYQITSLTSQAVAPVTGVFDEDTAEVTAGNLAGDLDVGRYAGTAAADLDIVDVNSFAISNDFNIGGSQQGVIDQGVLNVAPVGGLAVTVGGDLVFGNGGPQGGTYNLRGGTLDVTGDILEGDQGAPDSAVNNAQLQINSGAVGAQALTVGGTVTVQRFSVGQDNASVAGLEISPAAGLATVESTGTTAIGTGTNASKDGDPGVVAGGNGSVVVGDGGSLIALNINIAENGDSRGALTIQNGGTVNSTQRIYVAGGAADDNDNETVGSITMEPGSSLTVQTGNLEIGRSGEGSFTFNGGIYVQLANNLVLGQSGGSHLSEGTVTIAEGTFLVGDAGNGDLNSDLNINNGGGTVTQTGGEVAIERNLNMAGGANPSSYTMSGGTLFVGQDYSSRGGDAQDDLVLSGNADVFLARDLNVNGGVGTNNNNLVEITGSNVLLEVGDDLVASNSRATLRWVADADGVSPIQVGTAPDDVPVGFPDPGMVQINGAVLEVDLSALTATPTEILLIDSAFDAIVTGNFTDAALNPLFEGDGVPSAPGWAISYILGPDFNDVGLVPGGDPDSDGDGMPASYETANGLDDNDPADADSDYDGDGFTALFEFAMGTLAGDPTSQPVFIIRRNGAQMEIEYGPITNGTTYKVNASADGESFSEIDTFTAGADGASNTVIDTAVFLDVELYQLEVTLP